MKNNIKPRKTFGLLRGKRIASTSGIVVLSIVIAFLIGELIAKIVVHINPVAPPPIVCTETEIRYVPNWKGICRYSGTYKAQTNSMGLRERELPFKKKDGVFRLLFLGDSITYGPGVETDKTFVRIIENLLNTNSGGRKFETINAGVGGASTIQEITLLKKIGFKYQPDIVILNFYLNDIRPPVSSIQQPVFSIQYIRGYLYKKSELYKLFKKGYCNLRLKLLHNEVPLSEWWNANIIKRENWKKDKETFYELLYQPSAAGDWGMPFILQWRDYFYEKTREYLRGLKQLGEENNFKLIIVCFPVYFQVGSDFLEDEPQKRLSLIVQEENIPFLDLLPYLRESVGAGLPCPYLDHCHLSQEGHKLVAEKIYQFIRAIL